MHIMEKILLEYENLIISLPKLIKNSKFKTEVFIRELGLTTATFYRKMKENRFTLEEVKKLTSVIKLENSIDRKLAQSESDIINDRVMTKEQALS